MPIGSNKLDFISFYNRFLPRVYRYVRYRVADTLTAEDLTSDVFEKALHSWDKLRNPDLMASWIFRIARNTVVSHYRRKGHLADVPLDSIQNKTSTAVDPEKRAIHAEQWERIYDSIHRLSSREQHIIALKFGSRLNNRTIAPIVGTSEGNVAVILHRSMRKLLKYMEGNRVPASTSERIVNYD